jgi:hypothetical protein
MNTQLTIDPLEELRLHGMTKTYQAILTMPVLHQPTISQFMARLAEAELQERSQARTAL